MLIPHLHFPGNCEHAIAVYEKAFQTKAECIVYNHEYAPGEYPGDNRIAHAEMYIHGQKVYLNDRFGNGTKSLDCAVHLIVMFESAEELLDCFGFFEAGSTVIDPFTDLPYSRLAGNFMDEFGVLWGFMVTADTDLIK